MEKKTNLEKEAIAAFNRQYEELPADAGWPVVKQWKNEVYFARSLEEWRSYKIGQILTELLFKAVLLLTLGIIGLAVFGYYKIALYCAIAYPVLFVCTFLLPKGKKDSEIRNYHDGRICRIVT